MVALKIRIWKKSRIHHIKKSIPTWNNASNSIWSGTNYIQIHQPHKIQPQSTHWCQIKAH